MAKITITDDLYKTIVEGLHNGSCVPFLGAGVNLKGGAGDEEEMPLGNEVALRLVEALISNEQEKRKPSNPRSAINTDNLGSFRNRTDQAKNNIRNEALPGQLEQLEELLRRELRKILPDDEQETRLAYVIIDDALEQFRDLTRVALQDLARVSLRYREQRDLPNFVATLKTIIPEHKCKPSQLLRTLARLPLPLIVTTNYDRLMERSLELFDDDAVRKPDELWAAVLRAETALADFIFRKITGPKRASVVGDANPGITKGLTAEQWAGALNNLIQDTRLFLFKDEALMRGGLPFEVWKMVNRRPESLAQVVENRRLLESHFAGQIRPHHKPYQVMVQPVKGFQGPSVHDTQRILSERQNNRELILYKLHGTFTDGEPEEETRPVITEEDYIEFLTFVGGDGIDNQLKKDFQKNTLLFLGYSLEDWNFRTLFKGIIEKPDAKQQRLSYAIQKSPSDFWVTYWHRKNVQILDVDICEFAAELDRRCREHRARMKAGEDADVYEQLEEYTGSGRLEAYHLGEEEQTQEIRGEGASDAQGDAGARKVRYAKY